MEKPPFREWAIVELMGHQKIVGLATEAAIAGAALLRVDVPAVDDKPAYTRFYGASAIYSINPVTEEIARHLVKTYRPEPVNRFDLPALEAKVTPSDEAFSRSVEKGSLDEDDEPQTL